MATLNTNNRVLTLYNKDRHLALSLNSNTVAELRAPGAVRPAANERSHDPYLGLVRYCAALSPDGRLYAAAAEKELTIWSTDDWRQNCARTLPRSASRITFAPSGDQVLVADKSGDVYAYWTDGDAAAAGGRHLLGHLSMPLDILVTPDREFVVTCDRDEKIRVSRYPNAYNIERFCLGHAAFVTKIAALKGGVLLSASGDGTLKFWRYARGDCVASYGVREDARGRCIVTDVATREEADQLVACVSVFEYDGLLVYSCPAPAHYRLTLVQRIECLEPLDFVCCESVLWILNYSTSRLLKAFSWDGEERRYSESAVPSPIEDACRIVNENCGSIDRSPVDISVLCKRLQLKEKSVAKKPKLG